MAKMRAKKSKRASKEQKKKSSRKISRERVATVINQVKEPLSLLNTLKEEGMANAVAFMGLASAMASGATKNFRLDSVRPQLGELISSLGFALREDVEKLEARIEELELKISEKEFEEMRESDEE